MQCGQVTIELMMLYIIIVLLLPLVTEVFLKVLLITDHPTVIADAVLHHLGNAMVTKEFQTRCVCVTSMR